MAIHLPGAFVFVGTAYGLMWVLPLGTPLAYPVQFLAAAVILAIAMAVDSRDPVGNDAARLVLAEDQPGEFDELIASRSRLKLCSCVAAIEEIELGLLAHCLQQGRDAFLSGIAELTAAQYVCGRHDAGRVWISLTPSWRAGWLTWMPYRTATPVDRRLGNTRLVSKLPRIQHCWSY